MRLIEFREDFPKMPEKYPYDEESGLFLNTPSQWSTSPYLGAVISSKYPSKWFVQIHISRTVWEDLFEANPKWRGSNIPKGFFNEDGKLRSSIRFRVSDPRQAAWISQTVLYGPYDTNALVEEYIIARYFDGVTDIRQIWDFMSDMPHFSGPILSDKDKDHWMANYEAKKKENKLANNIASFKAKMPEKIKQVIINFVKKSANRRKVFGNPNLSLNVISRAIDKAINVLGVDYFLQGIHVKDPSTFKLASYVSESENQISKPLNEEVATITVKFNKKEAEFVWLAVDGLLDAGASEGGIEGAEKAALESLVSQITKQLYR